MRALKENTLEKYVIKLVERLKLIRGPKYHKAAAEIDNLYEQGLIGDFRDIDVVLKKYNIGDKDIYPLNLKGNKMRKLNEDREPQLYTMSIKTVKKLFVGDPCYAIPKDSWRRWLDVSRNGCGAYNYFVPRTIAANTYIGDGTYKGEDDGREYSVDSGTIGVVDISFEQKYTDERLNELGRVIEFEGTKDVTIDLDRTSAGLFTIIITADDGEYEETIQINTGLYPESEDEDGDYDERDYYGYDDDEEEDYEDPLYESQKTLKEKFLNEGDIVIEIKLDNGKFVAVGEKDGKLTMNGSISTFEDKEEAKNSDLVKKLYELGYSFKDKSIKIVKKDSDVDFKG